MDFMVNPPDHPALHDKLVRQGSNTTPNRLAAHVSAIKDHSRRHGLSGTSKWLAGKTVFARWTAVVFSDDASLARHPSAWPDAYQYAPLVRVAELSAVQLQQLSTGGFQDLAVQLAANDEIYWVTRHEIVVSVGAVLHRSPQRSVLGLPGEALLIGHCETAPSHRNKGLYARAINETVLALRYRGLRSVFMETRPANERSQKGILRAGLLRERVVHAQIFFRSLVVRRDGVEWIKRA
jgi:RimJ/RimL family protein N-acetyltransferase